MRWVIVGAALMLVAAALVIFLQGSSPPPEPTIAEEGIVSDPECFDLLRQVARRDVGVFEAIDRGGKPIGLRCSINDIIKIMHQNGGRIRSTLGSTIRFNLRSRERYFLSKPSKFGFYQTDVILISINAEGIIQLITLYKPYIT